MVTDEQYKNLLKRVEELEKQLNTMSFQLNSVLMKSNPFEVEPVVAKEQKSSARDTTKYKFNGKIYCKRQLVFAVIKRFLADNNIGSYEELVEIFPDYLQGALGVIKPVRAAEKYRDADKRYYFSDGDVILLNGERYVVCSQWDAKNISKFLDVAKKYYEIENINY